MSVVTAGKPSGAVRRGGGDRRWPAAPAGFDRVAGRKGGASGSVSARRTRARAKEDTEFQPRPTVCTPPLKKKKNDHGGPRWKLPGAGTRTMAGREGPGLGEGAGV